jgi:hypothetical protein
VGWPNFAIDCIRVGPSIPGMMVESDDLYCAGDWSRVGQSMPGMMVEWNDLLCMRLE